MGSELRSTLLWSRAKRECSNSLAKPDFGLEMFTCVNGPKEWQVAVVNGPH